MGMKSVGQTLAGIRERHSQTPLPPAPKQAAPACSNCADRGWYSVSVDVSDPQFGKVIPCECQSELWQERQREKLKVFAGLPSGLSTCTFADMEWSPPGMSDAQRRRFVAVAEYCRKYALGTTPEKWLLLAGSIGWGKSHLAACVVNERLRRNEIAKFLDFPSILEELKAGFEDNSYHQTLAAYQSVPLLVLDDLGAEYKGRNEGMSWSEGELYKIINYRYTNRLSTVLTTNVKPTELDARVADRIRDTGTGLSKLFVENLPSYRTAK